MTNYEKARTEIFEKINKQVKRGKSYKEVQIYAIGILVGLRMAEFLTYDEEQKLMDEILDEVDSKF